MDWPTIKATVNKKPPLFVLGAIFLYLGLIFLKWNIHLPLGAFLFLLGGVVGLYLVDIAELFFNVSPSPFKTMLFVVGSAVIGLYIISSTQEWIAKGLILGVNIHLLLLQIVQWREHHDLTSWYTLFFDSVRKEVHQVGLYSYGLVIIFLSLLFVF